MISILLISIGSCEYTSLKIRSTVEWRENVQNYNCLSFQYHQKFPTQDPNRHCITCNILLILILGPRTSKDITHQIKKVVYPFGDITDPVTGKKVVISKYRDEIEERNKLFGKNPDGFDFNKAPKRGWQKDKRDFTYRDTYRKYHLFEKEDPYAV
nr:EOG090X0GMQ [Eubosmina coregoni]